MWICCSLSKELWPFWFGHLPWCVLSKLHLMSTQHVVHAWGQSADEVKTLLVWSAFFRHKTDPGRTPAASFLEFLPCYVPEIHTHVLSGGTVTCPSRFRQGLFRLLLHSDDLVKQFLSLPRGNPRFLNLESFTHSRNNNWPGPLDKTSITFVGRHKWPINSLPSGREVSHQIFLRVIFCLTLPLENATLLHWLTEGCI